MPFDIEGAKQAGYSEPEIAAYLAESSDFDLQGAKSSGYSDAEIINHLSGYEQPQQAPPELKFDNAGVPITREGTVEDLKKATEPYVRPALEVGGLLGGGAIGTATSGPLGGVSGAGLGYAGGKELANRIYGEEQGTLPEELLETGKDIATGAEMEMLGPIIGKVAGVAFKGAGTLAKQVLGKTTGAGEGMIESALQSSPMFKASMRGKISGQDIVDNARLAVQELRDKRAVNYLNSLEKISQNKGVVDTSPIQNKFAQLLKKYNIKTTGDGGLDFSRIAMGKKGRADIEDVADIVSQWGAKEGDNTAMGLDVLKRQLDDFYSESSQARQFVTSLKNEIKNTISKNVPEYGNMVKKYSEATNLIKDIEAGLMLRKQGMSGRIVADQTLRRLTSSMRENFEMRKELVQILGQLTEKDLESQIAGYSAQQLLPRGLVGSLSGLSLSGLTYLNPKFWPLLTTASPRAVGEFLYVYGKGIRAIEKTSPATLKAMGYATGKAIEEETK